MARAIWKAAIRLDDVAVPVKLYSAVQDRNVRFRLLSAETLRPVKQRMVNPETGDVVPYDEIRRGYEVEDGTFVILDEEELDALQPEKSREIEILRFVPDSEIDHPWYDRPYHLGPDEDVESYFALAEALDREGTVGVARWAMRNREYRGALRVEDGHLMLITLRSAEEVVSASALGRPEGREPDARELRMAEQLVSALEAEFDPAAFRDEYRDRVMELIEAKAEGKTVELPAPAERRPTGDLAASLEASIQAARERKSA